MEPWTDRERRALAALADTLVPRSDLPGLESSAGDLGTPARVEEAAALLPPANRADLARLLRALSSRAGGLALAGVAESFADLAPEARERYLLRLADSGFALRRRAFAGAKRLVQFVHYTDRRTWPALGYAPPPAAPDPPAAPPVLPVWDGGAVDVVVVGSGAGGGVAAGVLAAAGRRVLVVEAAPLRAGGDFTGDEAEGMRDLYARSGALLTADESILLLAGRAAGGGTTVNWMTSLAPPPWLRAEWEAAGLDGLSGPAFDAHVAAVESRAHVTTDESAPNGANRVLEEGARRLGWSWRVLPRNARGCRGRCGFCVFGCPWSAKQGTLATWLADAAASGARFVFGTRVERVLVEGGRAAGVRLADGREVRARIVVLAAGAIETAALLLRSGVRSRGVGRLHLHPSTAVIARFDRRIAMWEGAMQTVAVEEFADLDGRHHGFLLEAVPGHPGLSASALPWRGGEAAKRDLARLANTAALLVLTREEGAGRVRLDARGEAALDYRVRGPDAARLLRGIAEASRLAAAAGAVEVGSLHAAGLRADPRDATAFAAYLDAVARAGVRPHGLALFSAHQMGTCALGRDGEAPADGASGRVFDVEGLYVADASAFPSPSGVNPMITIQALAHRTATRLAGA